MSPVLPPSDPDRVYGPHRAEDNPETVTVFRSEDLGGDVDVPYPDELARQRQGINNVARYGAVL